MIFERFGSGALLLLLVTVGCGDRRAAGTGGTTASATSGGSGGHVGAGGAGTGGTAASGGAGGQGAGGQDAGGQDAGGPDGYAFRGPQSGDLYVDAINGSDSNTGDSPAHAKKTLTAALLQSLVAGRALWMMNGSYAAPDVRTLNSGTDTSRITVAAYPGHSPVITFAPMGVVMGGGDYWDWRGIGLSVTVTGMWLGNTQGTGPEAPAHHWRFIDCVGKKSDPAALYTDNSGILFVDGGAADYIEVVRGSYTGAGGPGTTNSSGLWFDYLHHVKVIGAFIDDFDLPIYFKHYDGAPQSEIDIEITNNVISRGHRYLALAANWVHLSNNVVVSCDLYPSERGGGVNGGNYGRYVHNTLWNSSLWLDAEGGLNLSSYLRDNVFAGKAGIGDAPYSSDDDQTDTAYNLFTAASNVYLRDHDPYSLSAYRAQYPGKEASSLAATISLAGGATPSATTSSDWALAAGSPGVGAADDGKDMGVDVTKLLTTNE